MLMKSLSLCSYTFPSSSFSATEIPTNPTLIPFKSSKSRNLCLSTQNGGFKDNNNSDEIGRGDAVIIVDHGSRRKESNLMLRITGTINKRCFPILRSSRCIPCYYQSLFPLSWKALESEATKEHPGVSYVVTAPLGPHELLVDVVNDRIKHCLEHVAGDADEC